MDGEEARHAAAFLELAADEVPGPFRRDHEDVHALRRNDLLEMNVEAVAEGEIVAVLEAGLDLFFVRFALQLVGEKYHDDERSSPASRTATISPSATASTFISR